MCWTAFRAPFFLISSLGNLNSQGEKGQPYTYRVGRWDITGFFIPEIGNFLPGGCTDKSDPNCESHDISKKAILVIKSTMIIMGIVMIAIIMVVFVITVLLFKEFSEPFHSFQSFVLRDE